VERVWASRLRWRLRGAWLAPLLVVLTVADALLLHALPLTGDRTGLDGGLLLASLFNFLAVVVVAPVAAVALRRARPDLPFAIARDRAGAVLVLLLAAVLLAAGLHHRPAIVRDRAALADAHARGVAWIGAHAPAEFRRHVALADTIAIDPGRVYRTCVPSPGSDRAWCAVVPRNGPIRFGGGEPNALFQAGRE
jgi:4-amino-4-deoxy-L-arabinose transferase-like glycosyltransferase